MTQDQKLDQRDCLILIEDILSRVVDQLFMSSMIDERITEARELAGEARKLAIRARQIGDAGQ